MSEAERGAELFWRAVPTGVTHAVSTSEQRFTWKGLHARPWSPCRLRAERTGAGGLRLGWTPRRAARAELWDVEDDLSKSYQITIRANGRGLRVWEAPEPATEYEAGELAADLAEAGGGPLRVEVREGAAGFGWGAPALGEL